MRASTIASIRSSLLGKRRNRVASPTPARSAISAVDASSPRSAKTSVAAATIRARFRAASARSTAGELGGGSDRIAGIDSLDVAAAEEGRHKDRPGRDQGRGHDEGKLVALHQGRLLLRLGGG